VKQIPVYLINLDTDEDRLAFVGAQLRELNIEYNRFSAIRGANLPEWLVPYFGSASPLTVGEIGCYASHLQLMRIVAEQACPFVLILDCVQDPHNLGACLRSADAAGACAVIVPRDRSAAMSPVVAKAAAGAAETVPLVAVTNLARAMEELKQEGVWIAGAAGEAERSVYELDLTGPLGWALGAEGEGLRRLTRERCDWLARIPLQGTVDSLNVSVAAGVCLFETQRQRAQAIAR
jgi:23S rRNA (guanosine2251-2'-O)-methyltransferase